MVQLVLVLDSRTPGWLQGEQGAGRDADSTDWCKQLHAIAPAALGRVPNLHQGSANVVQF